MTEKASTKFAVPDSGEQVLATSIQYGMRFPDNTIRWVELEVGSGRTIKFKELYEDGAGNYWWGEYITRRAAAANIDAEKYKDQHQIVKRTVVLALTEAEAV